MAKKSGSRILVLGDGMMDEHTFCRCERLSPEAPVPVGIYEREERILGGAANVAHQIAIGAPCTLTYVRSRGCVEQDFLNLCYSKGIDILYLDTNEKYHLPRKRRIWLSGQQSNRVDREIQNVSHDDDIIEEWVLTIINHIILCDINIVIFSDYDKGVLTDKRIQDITDFCNTRNTITILDPKRPTYGNFKGISIIKPNSVEIKATGETLEELSQKMGQTYLIHTKGMDGMDCYQNGKLITCVHAHEVEVSDVCGAGDTVTSVMALGLRQLGRLDEITIKTAMSMASFAASRTVTHRGSYVLNYNELSSLMSLNW
jgi:D-beta-D-heptose 7-phosphate kinase/D-beta-D-heptose 1-phosphate adenosyltransferase